MNMSKSSRSSARGNSPSRAGSGTGGVDITSNLSTSFTRQTPDLSIQVVHQRGMSSPSTSPGIQNNSITASFARQETVGGGGSPTRRPLTPSTSPVRNEWTSVTNNASSTAGIHTVGSMDEVVFDSESATPNWKFQLFNGPKDQHGEDLMQAVPLRSVVLRLIPYCLIGFFLLANALNITHTRMLDPRNERPLPDLSEDIFPKIEGLAKGTDICVWIQNIGSLLVVWKLYLVGRGSRAPQIGRQLLGTRFEILVNNPISRFILLPPMTIRARVLAHERNKIWYESLCRYFATYGTLLFIRSVVIVVTVLPATDNHCQQPQEITNWWGNVFMTVITFGGSSIHCGDLLFSGHMTIITIGMLSVWEYGPIVSKLLRPIAALTWLASWFTILISRSHYTDDVIIAFVLTFLMFHLYRRTALVNREGSTPCRLVRTVPRWMYCVLSPAYGAHCIRRVCARYDVRGLRINDQVASMPPPYDIDAELGPAIKAYTTQAETAAARHKDMEEST